MAEPVKVNAYYIVSSFAAGKECWWVLSDGETAIIVRPENVFEMDKEKGLWSIIIPKHLDCTKITRKHIHSIMKDGSESITLVERDMKNGSNKQNVTKI